MKAKLRVTLKKLSSVKNTFDICDITTQIIASATVTQNGWLRTIVRSGLFSLLCAISSDETLIVALAVRRFRWRP
jgi:hypothetical protein